MASSDNGKAAAAREAAARIQGGMTVGLGTGSTAAFFLEALAVRMRTGELSGIRGVPTSRRAEEQALGLGIPLVALGRDARPDVTVDGADEIDPALCLIKGGGGAHVREKLVAVASREMIVVADDSKAVATLGAFPLPVAVFPYGWETTLGRLEDVFGVPAVVRRAAGSSEPFSTDDGLYLIDLHVGAIPDPAGLHARVRAVTGVAEVGLFVGIATRALLGSPDGTVRELLPR